MFAKPHPRSEAAREIRVYNAQRLLREQARRNAERIARVAGRVSE